MSIVINNASGAVLLNGNPIFINLTSTDFADKKRYYSLLRIVSVDGKLVGAPYIDGIHPGSNGTAQFDISGYVRQPFQYEFEHPQANKIVERGTLLYKIEIEAGEQYLVNGKPQQYWTGTKLQFSVLAGGLSKRQQNFYRPENFYADFVQQNKFLTWQPTAQTVSPHSPIKLWFFLTAQQSQTFRLYYYYKYKFFKSVSMGNFEVNFNPESLYELNLSLSQLGIDVVDGMGTELEYLNVYLGDPTTGNEVTEHRRFYFDHQYYENNNHIYYTNSLGGIDALWCSGEFKELLKSETTFATRHEQQNDTMFAATIVTADVSAQRKWLLNTGIKFKPEIAALRDLILSKDVWLAEGNKLTAVYLDNKEQLLADIEKSLDSLDLVLFEAHRERYF